ncbi:MAG: thioredoxin-disulfide reductase [Ruminococcaceae bacterium]|nr:thioredoxin-disulfide reductase [Oscillospiraceae bacterium]
MENLYDIIIIGGGPAGYSAALYSARAGFKTLVIEKMGAGGQMALTDIIDNYPGFENGIDGFTLGMNMQKGAERFGAKTEYCEVVSVDLTAKIKKVVCDSNEFYGKALIIATGASPKNLGIDREDELLGRGVHYCAHCDGGFYRNKTVVVVGGGNSAVADALYITHVAKQVYMVHRRDKLRATKIYHEPLMQAQNLDIIWDSAVSKLLGEDRISGVKIKNLKDEIVRELECDAVFVSIGRTPATDFLKGRVNLDENGYIIADETTKTNINGVYAVGDVRTKALRQVVTAVADGATAVHFAEEYISALF